MRVMKIVQSCIVCLTQLPQKVTSSVATVQYQNQKVNSTVS